ncbi:MAG: thioredoxin family protein [Verrucomicrobiota bacterium JB022]|nr:thioredoxin family protein [Verrucomicrobiota bacterium JB022]
MALTPSTMLALGTPCPRFSLRNVVDQQMVSLSDYEGAKGLLVLFICNHCPYVKLLKKHLAELARAYQEQGIATVAINSNDTISYPDDAPPRMKADAEEFGYPFPYLFDEKQEVAKDFRAACTPDIYLFDQDQKLVYRGQYDDSRPGNNKPVTGADLRRALDALLAGQTIPEDEQKPATGCNIKWKAGNAPKYFG